MDLFQMTNSHLVPICGHFFSGKVPYFVAIKIQIWYHYSCFTTSQIKCLIFLFLYMEIALKILFFPWKGSMILRKESLIFKIANKIFLHLHLQNTNPTIRTSMDGCLCPPVDFANILHPEAKFTSANGNNRKMEKLFAQGAFSS